MKVSGYIYRVYNKIDGKSYIGQTLQNPYERIRRHFRGTGSKFLSEALNADGRGAFKWEILERLRDITKLNEREAFYIQKFNSVSPYGYNLSVGGEGRPGKVRAKISEVL